LFLYCDPLCLVYFRRGALLLPSVFSIPSGRLFPPPKGILSRPFTYAVLFLRLAIPDVLPFSPFWVTFPLSWPTLFYSFEVFCWLLLIPEVCEGPANLPLLAWAAFSGEDSFWSPPGISQSHARVSRSSFSYLCSFVVFFFPPLGPNHRGPTCSQLLPFFMPGLLCILSDAFLADFICGEVSFQPIFRPL